MKNGTPPTLNKKSQDFLPAKDPSQRRAKTNFEHDRRVRLGSVGVPGKERKG